MTVTFFSDRRWKKIFIIVVSAESLTIYARTAARFRPTNSGLPFFSLNN